VRLGFRADWEDCQYGRVYYQNQFLRMCSHYNRSNAVISNPDYGFQTALGRCLILLITTGSGFLILLNQWTAIPVFWRPKTESKALVRVISKPSHKTGGFLGGNLQDLSTEKRKNRELHAFLSMRTWSFLSCTKSALGFGGIGTFWRDGNLK